MNTVEVHYNCPHCKIDFVVYHTTEARNEKCFYCGHKVKLTGIEKEIEGKYYVTYKDGVEVAREKIKERRFHK